MRADHIKRKETTRSAQAHLEQALSSAGWMNPANLIEETETTIFALMDDRTGAVGKQAIVERASLCESVSNMLAEALSKVAGQSYHGRTNDLVKLSDAIVRTSIAQARLLALASAIQIKGDGDLTRLAQPTPTLEGDRTTLEGDTDPLEMQPLEATPGGDIHAP